MNERWMWVMRYVIVIVLALALAWVLGDMALFKTTRFGKTGLTAARLAQFLGNGGALVVFWLLAQRAAELSGPEQGRWLLVKPMILPLATLAVIAIAHPVVLRALGSMMTRSFRQGYNWGFIAALVACAVWLVVAVLSGAGRARRL
ncbi:MAG TPA: hypothetical protein VEL09_16990 [Burkholderiales bacterium]|nr:hypothetical protein [Burkholderiales bacterium]